MKPAGLQFKGGSGRIHIHPKNVGRRRPIQFAAASVSGNAVSRQGVQGMSWMKAVAYAVLGTLIAVRTVAPVYAQGQLQRPASTEMHVPFGPGPVVGGTAGPSIDDHVLVRPQQKIASLLVIYEDVGNTDVTTGICGASAPPARRGLGIGDAVVRLTPQVFAQFGVEARAVSANPVDAARMTADHGKAPGSGVLWIEDSGSQNDLKGHLEFHARLDDSTGARLWTGTAQASFMGVDCLSSGAYTANQTAVVRMVLSDFANRLRNEQVTVP